MKFRPMLETLPARVTPSDIVATPFIPLNPDPIPEEPQDLPPGLGPAPVYLAVKPMAPIAYWEPTPDPIPEPPPPVSPPGLVVPPGPNPDFTSGVAS